MTKTYQEKVAAIADEIRDVLKDGLDAQRYAAGILEKQEDGLQHIEIRGFHTRTGNPYTFYAEI